MFNQFFLTDGCGDEGERAVSADNVSTGHEHCVQQSLSIKRMTALNGALLSY